MTPKFHEIARIRPERKKSKISEISMAISTTRRDKNMQNYNILDVKFIRFDQIRTLRRGTDFGTLCYEKLTNRVVSG